MHACIIPLPVPSTNIKLMLSSAFSLHLHLACIHIPNTRKKHAQIIYVYSGTRNKNAWAHIASALS
jgi:hypothetical protein